MLVEGLNSKATLFKNFEVWEVEDIVAFFNINGVLKEIFEKEYKIKYSEFSEKRKKIPETDAELMSNLLDMVADKHFFPFTFHNPNHLELIEMQITKVMNFGIDISDIKKDSFYILVMDKA